MAESSNNIQNENENATNISAEVPGEQKIREIDSHYEETADTSTCSEITDTDHTLSPVIIVTKNEITLTKGDLKLQKVTVKEDIAVHEAENGGHRISYADLGTDRQTVRLTVKAMEKVAESGEKMSRIPKKKFVQTVEKVQKEIQELTTKDRPDNQPRKSSIPISKNAKAVKRKTSIQSEGKVDDEFDRIYEEIVVNKPVDTEGVILRTKSVDDPEKVESKFEEIIHAYDSNDDNYFSQSEKIKLSKIPSRKPKQEDFAIKSNLKDGGFKISATNITTKRLSRDNSLDLGKAQKMDVIDISNTQYSKDHDEEVTSVKNVKTDSNSVKVNTDIHTPDDDQKIVGVHSYEVLNVEQSEGNITNANDKKTKIPRKAQFINRGISRELNRRPANLDDGDFFSRELIKHKEFDDGPINIMITDTIIKEPETKVDKVKRSISRTFSRDGKSITISPTTRQSNIYENAISQNDSSLTESGESNMEIKNVPEDSKENVDHDVLHTEKCTQLPAPVITKGTHSYSKGRIRTVGRSKSIEWNCAREITYSQQYTRSYSEKKIVINDHEHKNGESIVEENKIEESKTANTDNENVDTTDVQNLNDTMTILPKGQEADYLISNNMEVSRENMVTSSEISTPLQNGPSDEKKGVTDTLKNVTVLKGNVSRLISQISVKDNTDVTKKVVDVEEELPKKKTVLSKIAMFEGKEPGEVTIKIKKCILDKEPAILAKSENTDQISRSVTGRRNDEPVIVDELWKFQEQNISTICHTVDIMILPEAIDFIVDESDIENREINIETDNDLLEITGEIHKHGIGQNSTTQYDKRTLPKNYELVKQSLPESVTTLPANVDFISDKNEGTIVKFSAEKLVSKNQPKVEKTKVGKLNLDLWQQQVQENKQLVRKGKYIVTDTAVIIPKLDLAKTKGKTKDEPQDLNFQDLDINLRNQYDVEEPISLPNKLDSESDAVKAEFAILLPDKVRNKSDGHYELPTILPAKTEFTSSVSLNEVSKNIPSRINLTTKEDQLQVPVVLPETPLTKTLKLDFENKKNQGDGPTFFFGSIPVTPDIPITVPLKIEQVNFSTPEVHICKLETKQNDYISDTKNTHDANQNIVLEEVNYFNSIEDHVKINELLPSEINDHLEKDDQFKEIFSEDNNNTEDVNNETPSDPELVDSEAEIKDHKSTIMGRLKNKLYLITNKNINKIKTGDLEDQIFKTHILSSTSNSNKNESQTFNKHTTPFNNKDNSTRSRHDVNIKTNMVRNSIHELEIDRPGYRFREDMKRTKSLAELDLGDAVKGQVQRMIYRIKSVDFDRMETPRSRKISLREMPRKSSVMEKIALFEAKALSTMPPGKVSNISTVKIDNATVTRDVTESVQESNLTETTTEEDAYIRQMKDLSTVKSRYLRTGNTYLTLNNGMQMPSIGLGTALMDNRMCPNIVSAAIDLGYRAFDTAYIYGTEAAVGQGINMKINDGTVKREDLFISGKLWSTFHAPQLVRTACTDSLKTLGLEYFDLYMLHNPISLKENAGPVPIENGTIQFSQYDYMDAWTAMEELAHEGLVKSIGVSNFNSRQIQNIINNGTIKPTVLQVECNPYLTQEPLQEFCNAHEIVISSFSVLGSKGTPQEYKNGIKPVIDDPLIRTIAAGMKVTPGQLLVGYQIASGRQAIVKASSSEHLWDVLQAYTMRLETKDVKAINTLNRNARNFDLKMFGATHKNYPFNIPF